MQAFKYTLRLLLCRPLLAMLAALVVICIVLAMIASLFMPSLTWQAALAAGARFGGILAAGLWCIFFMKTYMAVSASSTAMPEAEESTSAGTDESSAAGDQAAKEVRKD